MYSLTNLSVNFARRASLQRRKLRLPHTGDQSYDECKTPTRTPIIEKTKISKVVL
jgi:hypothetical protein